MILLTAIDPLVGAVIGSFFGIIVQTIFNLVFAAIFYWMTKRADQKIGIIVTDYFNYPWLFSSIITVGSLSYNAYTVGNRIHPMYILISWGLIQLTFLVFHLTKETNKLSVDKYEDVVKK